MENFEPMFRETDTTPSEGRWVDTSCDGEVMLMEGTRTEEVLETVGNYALTPPRVRQAVRDWVDQGWTWVERARKDQEDAISELYPA